MKKTDYNQATCSKFSMGSQHSSEKNLVERRLSSFYAFT